MGLDLLDCQRNRILGMVLDIFKEFLLTAAERCAQCESSRGTPPTRNQLCAAFAAPSAACGA